MKLDLQFAIDEDEDGLQDEDATTASGKGAEESRRGEKSNHDEEANEDDEDEESAEESEAEAADAKAADDDEQMGRALANLQDVLARDYKLAEAEGVFDEGMDYCSEHDIGAYEHCLRGSQGFVLDKAGGKEMSHPELTAHIREVKSANMKALNAGTTRASNARDKSPAARAP